MSIRVRDVLWMLGAGVTETEILADLSDLEPDDIRASLLFAALRIESPELPACPQAISEIPILILWRPSYDSLRQHTLWFQFVETRGSRTYHDGSLQIEEQSLVLGALGMIGSIQQQFALLPLCTVGFRPLAPFGGRAYLLCVPHSYEQACREMGPVILPLQHEPESAGERELSALSVSVEFVKRARGRVQDEFIRHANQSYATAFAAVRASDSGADVIGNIEFPGHRASFQIDASGADQFAINGFTLSMLDFGRRVLPVSAVAYGRGAEALPVGGRPDIRASLSQVKREFPRIREEGFQD